MKAAMRILCCCSLALGTELCHAQFNVYHPFPDSNAVWGMVTSCTEPSCGGDWAYVQNYITGDTVIDGLVYKKIWNSALTMSNNNCCAPPNGDTGFLREDTIAQKVYWRYYWQGADSLLYDFTIDVGDTLRGLPGSCQTWVVQAVDSVLIGPDYRKRLWFTRHPDAPGPLSCAGPFIIEGIGSNRGLVPCFVEFWDMIHLSCFAEDAEVLYSAQQPCGPDTVPCDLHLAVPEGAEQRHVPVRIAPNPAVGKLDVDFDPTLLPVEVSITSMTGKTLMREVIFKEHSTIDISGLAKGLYVLQVEREGSVISSSKIIKQ